MHNDLLSITMKNPGQVSQLLELSNFPRPDRPLRRGRRQTLAGPLQTETFGNREDAEPCHKIP